MSLKDRIAAKKAAKAKETKAPEVEETLEDVVSTEVIETEVVEETPVEETPAPKKAAKKEPKKKAQPPAVKQETAPVTRSHYNTPAGVIGDWDESDFDIPRLGVVQQIGKLAKEFDYTSLVYDGSHQLNEKGESVNLVVVGLRKYYKEHKSFDAEGEMPRTFDSLAEAREAGFTEGFEKDNNEVGKAADLDVLIVVDEELEEFNFNGISFVLARWSVDKTAFNSTAKKAFNEVLRGLCKESLYNAVWEAGAFDRTSGRTSWASPYLRNPKDSSDELGEGFAEWVVSQGIGQ